ncbi:MAG: phosphatase PAP2 family protein [Bdellovibrionota bacterium]
MWDILLLDADDLPAPGLPGGGQSSGGGGDVARFVRGFTGQLFPESARGAHLYLRFVDEKAWHLASRFYWIWALAIFASTLTTKQHYFYDILGGLVVAACVGALEYLYARKTFILTAKLPVK